MILQKAMDDNETLKEQHQILLNLHTEEEITEHETETNNKSTEELFKCSQCDFTSNDAAILTVHMKTKHMVEGAKFKCNKCDNVFTTLNALKQHTQSKHEASARVPVGHQVWANKQNVRQVQIKISCTNCPAEFRTEHDLKEHTKTHKVFKIACNECDEKFEIKQDLNHHIRTAHREFKTIQKPCRHFKRGWCEKGQMCSFSHALNNNQWPQMGQEQQAPTCRRGPGCTFWAQGTCFYYHQRAGVKQEQEQYLRSKQQKKCHFQERCWNLECRFAHVDFGMEKEFLENY